MNNKAEKISSIFDTQKKKSKNKVGKEVWGGKEKELLSTVRWKVPLFNLREVVCVEVLWIYE